MAAPAYINTTRVDVMLFLVCCNVVAMECPCDLITLQGRGRGGADSKKYSRLINER